MVIIKIFHTQIRHWRDFKNPEPTKKNRLRKKAFFGGSRFNNKYTVRRKMGKGVMAPNLRDNTF